MFTQIRKRDGRVVKFDPEKITSAIAKAGADRTKIRDYLAGLDSPEKGYKGVTGVNYFDGNGDCLKPAYVKFVKDGKFVPAEKQMN